MIDVSQLLLLLKTRLVAGGPRRTVTGNKTRTSGRRRARKSRGSCGRWTTGVMGDPGKLDAADDSTPRTREVRAGAPRHPVKWLCCFTVDGVGSSAPAGCLLREGAIRWVRPRHPVQVLAVVDLLHLIVNENFALCLMSNPNQSEPTRALLARSNPNQSEGWPSPHTHYTFVARLKDELIGVRPRHPVVQVLATPVRVPTPVQVQVLLHLRQDGRVG